MIGLQRCKSVYCCLRVFWGQMMRISHHHLKTELCLRAYLHECGEHQPLRIYDVTFPSAVGRNIAPVGSVKMTKLRTNMITHVPNVPPKKKL